MPEKIGMSQLLVQRTFRGPPAAARHHMNRSARIGISSAEPRRLSGSDCTIRMYAYAHAHALVACN